MPPFLVYLDTVMATQSPKKLLEGESLWEIRKETLGWVFNGTQYCIELPTAKLDTIIWEVKLVLRQPSIPYTRFERLVGKLRHVAIGL